jgi:hypothetical protein
MGPLTFLRQGHQFQVELYRAIRRVEENKEANDSIVTSSGGSNFIHQIRTRSVGLR